MNLNDKIKENYKAIQSMSNDNYEAYIVALLIYEKEGTELADITEEQLEVYKGVYSDFLGNDYFDLLNDNFDDTIEENRELYKEEKEEQSKEELKETAEKNDSENKTKKTKEQER